VTRRELHEPNELRELRELYELYELNKLNELHELHRSPAERIVDIIISRGYNDTGEGATNS